MPPGPQDVPASESEVPGHGPNPETALLPGPQDLPDPAAEVPAAGHTAQGEAEPAVPPGPSRAAAPAIEAGEASAAGERFGGWRRRYARLASSVIEWRLAVVIAYLAICGLLVVIVGRALGTEIFPTVDTGQFALRLRAQPGTRIDHTEQIALKALEAIKREVGPENLGISLGFVGTQPPNFAINTIYLWSSGSEEAMLQIQLKRGSGIRVEELKERLRKKLPQALPGVRFSFEPSDIVSRVMSFGAPTPIEVAVSGTDIAEIRRYAERLQKRLANVAMLRDEAFEQELDYPIIKVDFVRELAGMLGLTAQDVAHALVPATSSSRYLLPNYWADRKSGVGYQVQVEIPGPKINSAEEVQIVPIARRDGKQVAVRDVATVSKETTLGEYDRYNMQRMLTLSANITGDDLGGAATKVRQAIDSAGTPPKAATVTVRGQVRPMEEMFDGLRWGLLVAIAAILLLLTAYFQSFRLSAAVVLTIPAVIAGAAMMLWLTHTTLNIQSFMGTIMAVGVAVANSILLVTFAERSRLQGREPSAAAIEGATSRLRPIIMTGAAMIAGTIPMALGLGEGGEQTAPLGRAVIGGLSGALCATLLALPAIFTMLAPRSRTSASLDPEDPESRHFEGGDPPGTDDDRGSGSVENRTPPTPGPPQGQPGQHAEPRHPHTTGDDARSAATQSGMPADVGLQGRENQDRENQDGETPVPHVTPELGAVASVKSEIDISDRARIDTFGSRAQRAVVNLADRILAQTQNREIGTTGGLLADILAKARRLDPAAVNEGNYLTRMFSSVEARIQRFSEQFGTAASQIDRIRIDLERNKESLRRRIALLDELYEQTRTAIADLDAHIAAGKAFVEEFRAGRLVELEALAKSSSPGSDAVMAAQTHQDAVQALDRLEKRIFYLEQARQISIQQLPQIRIVQSGDETLIENLQAMTELTIPAWKQKMILLLGHNRQRSALALHRTVNDATTEMMRQASAMMVAQSIGVEPQYRRDDPPVEAHQVHAIDHGHEGEPAEGDGSMPLGL
ncbi:MAG: efflux RND transporter permease subunit [Alphaproteobacteria bacterium]|nr:efflux RND transporter permease subunit [Alphaproteobacteria bacterium]